MRLMQGLRERSFPKLDRIEGYIVQLRAETTLLEGFEGSVVVKADVAGTPTRVRVSSRIMRAPCAV